MLAQQPPARVLDCIDAGGSDSYACASPEVALASYTTGLRVRLFANTANTGAASVNISALGAQTIKKPLGALTTDLETGDIKAGQWVTLVYNGTNFQVESGLSIPQTLSWTLDGGGSALTAWVGPPKRIVTACNVNPIMLDANLTGSVTVLLEVVTYTTGSPSYSTLATVSLSSARSTKDTTGYAVAADSLLRPSVTGTPATITLATFELRCN